MTWNVFSALHVTQIFKYLQQVILELEQWNKANMLRDLSRWNIYELLHESYIRISLWSNEIFPVDCYNDGSLPQSWQQIAWLKPRLTFVVYISLKYGSIASGLSKSNTELLPVSYVAQTFHICPVYFILPKIWNFHFMNLKISGLFWGKI